MDSRNLLKRITVSPEFLLLAAYRARSRNREESLRQLYVRTGVSGYNSICRVGSRARAAMKLRGGNFSNSSGVYASGSIGSIVSATASPRMAHLFSKVRVQKSREITTRSMSLYSEGVPLAWEPKRIIRSGLIPFALRILRKRLTIVSISDLDAGILSPLRSI